MPHRRTAHRTGWLLARYSFLAALALVAVVNLLYVWPGKLAVPSVRKATSTVSSGARVQSRKQLSVSKLTSSKISSPLTVHLFCGDLDHDCEQQRHAGRCSTHLLQGFHNCMDSCGVCPALELAIRRSMDLTQQLEQQPKEQRSAKHHQQQQSHHQQHQLVMIRKQGPPPPCKDEIKGCADLVVAGSGEGTAARCPPDTPLTLVGACKATCGACQPSPAPKPAAGSGGGGGGGGCFDALDMCGWWARNDPRVCQRAAADLQNWWWVAVACRRSCGLCGGVLVTVLDGEEDRDQEEEEDDEEEEDGGVEAARARAAAALVAAAQYGVQVGEAADGSPAVAVFETLRDEPGACVDKEDRCSSWAASGECDRNPGFMAGTCPVSCRACPVLVNLPHPLARVRLNNGVLMPTVGYGTAGLGDDTARTVRWALEAGYRHLDSAQAREWYREDLVGAALAAFMQQRQQAGGGGAHGGADAAGVAASRGEGAVARKDIFVTSKLHPRHLGYDTTLRQFNQSLKDLHSTYVDLFLLHYPECWGNLCMGVQPAGTFQDSWRALERVYEAGLARAIGVSNFSPTQLSQLLASARIRPAVLQVHADPLGRSEEEQELCRREGLTLTAYSTLGTQYGLGGGGGGNPVLGHPDLRTMGQEAGNRSTAQVALRWALQQGLVVLPRSSNAGRIRQNLDLYGWGLTAKQMVKIGHLKPAT